MSTKTEKNDESIADQSSLILQRQTLEHILENVTQTQYENFEQLCALILKEEESFSRALKFSEVVFSKNLIEQMRLRFCGKKSPLQEWLKSLKNVLPQERKPAGEKINQLKAFIEKNFEPFSEKVFNYIQEEKLKTEKDDISLPFPNSQIGTRHPVSFMTKKLVDSLKNLGFTWVDGPEIEKDTFNFEALNIPPDHPAREMQDSFYLNPEWLLRTHTSSVQAHCMQERFKTFNYSMRIACPGYNYRNEHDMTHVPTFRQIEGLVVEKGINLGHMRDTLTRFFSSVFERPVKLRLRSSYFPFTEPSAEMDIECQQCFGAGCRSCKHTGWSELGGCGLVNPAVLEKCGIDSSVYSGFAFGMGIDRIAMSKFSISDLRLLFDADLEFLKELQTF
jgi:phenylalanyl-tRNA synthetase alpha chain